MPAPLISTAPPAPSRLVPSTFSALGDAFLAWMASAPPEFNALAVYLQNLALATGPGLFLDGTAAAPGVSFASDTDTGLFRSGANLLAFSAGGTQRALLSTTAFQIDVPITGTAVQASATDTTAGRLLTVGAFGLGVIGTAPVMAAIDATTTASGTYSYTTGATGTFPSGVTAAAGGVIVMYRESATKGYMTLQPTGSTDLYFRNLSTTWGAWNGFANLASPTFTGTPAVPTAAPATNTTQAASTAFVTAAAAAVAAAAGSMTLLGTLTTTSGSVQTLSSLNLTSYKELLFIFDGVSHGSVNVSNYSIGTAIVASLGSVSDSVSGRAYVSLANGATTPIFSNGANPAPSSGYSTTTTSVSISCSAGSFDAGTVLIYGVK